MAVKHAPATASRVLPGIPEWVYLACLVVYRREIRESIPKVPNRRLPHINDVENFLTYSPEIHPSCLIGFFDHAGHVKDTLIVEPYAASCEGCRKDAAAFAKRIRADLTITSLTFHAPEHPECIRMTFTPWKQRKVKQ